MADSKEKALHKHVRIAPEQWERLERAAQGTPHSPNQILVELAMEALDRRDWPSTEVEMRVARHRPRCSPPRPSPSTASPPGARARSRKSATTSRPSCPILTPICPTPTSQRQPLELAAAGQHDCSITNPEHEICILLAQRTFKWHQDAIRRSSEVIITKRVPVSDPGP